MACKVSGLQVCKTDSFIIGSFSPFLAGGYGKKLKRLGAGNNKWNSAGPVYDEYDYYTSGTEHYVGFIFSPLISGCFFIPDAHM